MNAAAPQNAKLSQTDNSQQIVDNTYLPADQNLDGVEGNKDPTQTTETTTANITQERIQKERNAQQELEPQEQIQVESKVYKSDLQDNGEQIVKDTPKVTETTQTTTQVKKNKDKVETTVEVEEYKKLAQNNALPKIKRGL